MSSSRLPTSVGLPAAMLAGVVIPLQGRINGALGSQLHDGLGAAVVSFSTGLILMLAVSLILPRGRAGLHAVLPAVRRRAFPPWYLLAGVVGAVSVVAQGLTVTIIGIALFTVATVTGQTVSGLLVDRTGLGPGGKRPVTLFRVLATVATVGAVVWAALPDLARSPDPVTWLLPILLPLVAGFGVSYQQAMNGTATVHYGSPLPTTLINFVVGTVVLWICWSVKLVSTGPAAPLPGAFWYYLGGPLGCVVVALGAVLVRSLGVLLTGLGTIAGQLLGSLALDLVVPAPGTVLAGATVLGTLLTLVTVVAATLPWPRAALRTGRQR